MMNAQHYPFTLPPLPYAYDALEPHIDTETMHYHHDKHFNAYIDNLNKALAAYPRYHDKTLAELLTELPHLPEELRTPVRNNAGGVMNHDLYFDSLAPQNGTLPAPLCAALKKDFGSLEAFADKLKTAALGVFGSGYGWLAADGAGALRVMSLPNQDSPLTVNLTPLLPLDVWEHAYYLKHKNLRADYIDAWFSVVDWNAVAARMPRGQG